MGARGGRALVRGVIAASMSAGCTTKSNSALDSTSTQVEPASAVCLWYER